MLFGIASTSSRRAEIHPPVESHVIISHLEYAARARHTERGVATARGKSDGGIEARTFGHSMSAMATAPFAPLQKNMDREKVVGQHRTCR